MSPLVRWLRFNLVGVIGMGVQLGALAVFNRLLAGRYLMASAVALEITLLHNFAWHVAWTWRDRQLPQGLKPTNSKPGFSARLKSSPYAAAGFSTRVKSSPYATVKALASPLMRFHLTNGLVSYVGNLALMRALVGGAHVPVVAANGIAILVCSVVNFVLADRWAFVASYAAAAKSGSDLVTLSASPPSVCD